MKNIQIICVLIVLVELTMTNGFYIRKTKNNNQKFDDVIKVRSKRNVNEDHSKFSDILQYWNEFKNKLKGNFDESSPEKSNIEKDNFNELEILQMIPIIIDNYRTNKISESDKDNLSKIYGNLWLIIEQEAKRNYNEEDMNPLLKALYDSFYLTKDITNDIDHNTVMEITKKSVNSPTSLSSISASSSSKTQPRRLPLRKKLFLNINKADHPSQRLLNVAAMLIHQAMNNNAMKNQNLDKSDGSEFVMPIKRRPYKIVTHSYMPKQRKNNKATLNLQLTDIPIKKITRNKRNVQIHISNSDRNPSYQQLEDSKIDALLRIYKNQNPNDLSDLLSYDSADDEDYDYESEPELNEHQNFDHEKNYFYNDLYEDDDNFDGSDGSLDGRKNNGPDIVDSSDYGSFQDLILLAERHRLRREMEEKRLFKKDARNFITASSHSGSGNNGNIRSRLSSSTLKS